MTGFQMNVPQMGMGGMTGMGRMGGMGHTNLGMGHTNMGMGHTNMGMGHTNMGGMGGQHSNLARMGSLHNQTGSMGSDASGNSPVLPKNTDSFRASGFTCSSCGKSIDSTSKLHYQCPQCSDGKNVDLCETCYSKGMQPGAHSTAHEVNTFDVQGPTRRFVKSQKLSEGNTLYDIFLSHRQVTGGGIALALKLELEKMRPGVKIFLDVDDLNNIHDLEENVRNSKNFLLLITEGVLERPFVLKEIRAALENKKNIIVMIDEKTPFPNGEGVPEDIKPVLLVKAIPYIHEAAFRKISIQSVLDKMVVK